MVASIIFLALLIAPLAPLNSMSAEQADRNVTMRRTIPRKIVIGETGMTLPFEMRVLLDDKNAYYNQSKNYYDYLLDFLENKYGFTVNATSIHNISYTSENISTFWLVIVPNPSLGNLTIEQQRALIEFVNKSKGYAWILGDVYPYTNKATLDNITLPFRVEILKTTVYDPTDNAGSYNKPYIYVWANNSVAQYVSGGGTYVVYTYKTSAVNFTDLTVNGTKYYLYPLAVGDNDTYTYGHAMEGSEVIYFAMVETPSHGYMLTSGSYGWITDYNFYDNDTYKFVEKLIEYGLSRDLTLTRFEYPSEPALAGQTLYINITVRNNANENITNIHVGLEFSGALNLLNDSNIYNISLLEPGQEINVTFAFSVTGTSDVVMEAKTWSDDTNVVGYQKRATFQTLGLILEASITPTYLVLGNFDHVKLTINVTNLAVNPNATNVNVSISLPEGVSTENDLFYHFDMIYNGTSQILELNITANTTGKKIISISLESENLGTASTEVGFSVYATPFIIYDQGHDQYYTADILSKFVSLLEEYGDVYINNGTLDKNLLGNATLLVIMHPEAPFTADEIALIKDFLENKSGKLIVSATWYKYFEPYVNNITADYGMLFQDAEIKDDEQNMGDPWNPKLYTLAKHPMCSDVEYFVAASSTYIVITSDVQAVVRGNPTSYGVTSPTDSYENETATGVNGTDLVAVAVKELNGGGIIVGFGGASSLSDRWYENNSLFIDNMAKWIFGDTEKPTVTIDAVNITDSEGNVVGVNLTITAEDNLALKSLVVTINGTEKYRNEDLLTHRYVSVSYTHLTLPTN